MRVRNPLRASAVAIMIVATTAVGAAHADASPPPATITQAEIASLTAQLDAAGYGYTLLSGNGGAVRVYHSNGFDLAVPQVDPAIDQSLIGGGFDLFNGPYVTLNRDEQNYYVGAGVIAAATAIGLAFVPAAPFAAGIAYALTAYIANNGVCPGNLRVYFPGTRGSCE